MPNAHGPSACTFSPSPGECRYPPAGWRLGQLAGGCPGRSAPLPRTAEPPLRLAEPPGGERDRAEHAAAQRGRPGRLHRLAQPGHGLPESVRWSAAVSSRRFRSTRAGETSEAHRRWAAASVSARRPAPGPRAGSSWLARSSRPGSARRPGLPGRRFADDRGGAPVQYAPPTGGDTGVNGIPAQRLVDDDGAARSSGDQSTRLAATATHRRAGRVDLRPGPAEPAACAHRHGEHLHVPRVVGGASEPSGNGGGQATGVWRTAREPGIRCRILRSETRARAAGRAGLRSGVASAACRSRGTGVFFRLGQHDHPRLNVVPLVACRVHGGRAERGRADWSMVSGSALSRWWTWTPCRRRGRSR